MRALHWGVLWVGLFVLSQSGTNEAQQKEASQPSGALQAQLSAIHLQAQRHMGQLNSLVLGAANFTQPGPQTPPSSPQQVAGPLSSTKFAPVLEALSSVGKAIQQQMNANPNVQIVTSGAELLANNKKNEYQLPAAEQTNVSSSATANYREQGEQLRQEIVKRASQLQQVVASSMDLMRNNSDLIVRRLLDQMNLRLDQAKSKADRILSEPATSEVAVRALATINLGLNNLNNMITNIVGRLEAASKQQQVGGQQQRNGGQMEAQGSLQEQQLKLRQNIQNLGQQFQSALNASGNQLAPFMRQRQQQIQQILSAAVQQQQQLRQQLQQQQQLQQRPQINIASGATAPSRAN